MTIGRITSITISNEDIEMRMASAFQEPWLIVKEVTVKNMLLSSHEILGKDL